MSSIKNITPYFFRELCADNACLKCILGKPRIFLNSKQQIIKIIHRRQKILSWSKFWPYWRRIKRNANLLSQKGIRCPQISDVFHYVEGKCDIVIYNKIAGISLEQIAKDTVSIKKHFAKLPSFIAHLHQNGIFFWDLHLGNILLDQENSYCLIDVKTVTLTKQALSIKKRARNLAKIFACTIKDITSLHLTDCDIEKFLQLYCKASNITPHKREKLRAIFNKKLLDYANKT